ncbi:hypothetical protein QFC21_002304 [Naganishia friedmannii]|uniref:Uncharacterized protein n=1 Tax=Naganishia friedmannii TaxID=89922 RepID=A0ACC2VY99_9TREE|nr:hypothetical protein QFC21_002304 [Naganishia friedmannii]
MQCWKRARNGCWHVTLSVCTEAPPPPPAHLQIHLSTIRQTEHYAGFFRSSPKITLYLGAPPPAGESELAGTNGGGRIAGTGAGLEELEGGWTCLVCGFQNEPTTSCLITATAGGRPGIGKCKLCGVPRPALAASSSSSYGGPGNTSKITAAAAAPSSSRTNNTAIPSAAGDPPPPVPVPGKTKGQNQACPRCTFLNNPHLPHCEICGARLPAAARPSSPSSPSPSSATPAPAPPPPTELIRLSFRKGGDKDLYKRLKTVLARRMWECPAGGGQSGQTRVGGAAGEGERAGTAPTSRGIGTAGIDGILATIDSENRAKTSHVQDAFEDLEALMLRAGEMVKLVQSLTAKLSSSSSSASATSPTTDAGREEAETRTFLHSSLVQLGLPVPAITNENNNNNNNRDEQAYLDALADELGGLLTREEGGGGLMVGAQGRGLVGMDEAWVIWNRARGVSLVAPKTMAKVVPLLPRHTRAPCTVRKLRFLSGLEVLHTPVYSPEVFARRVRGRLDSVVVVVGDEASRGSSGGAGEPYTTTLDIALTEALSVALTSEMMRFIIQIPDCGLVTDDGGGAGGGGLEGGGGDGPVGERWYRDLMTGYQWADPN